MPMYDVGLWWPVCSAWAEVVYNNIVQYICVLNFMSRVSLASLQTKIEGEISSSGVEWPGASV